MADPILEKDTICATVEDDHSFNCSVATIGRVGENYVAHIEITIPEELNQFWAYLDFMKPNGEKLRTPKIDIVENKIKYAVPLCLLDKNGSIEVQLVLQNENGTIWKSNTRKYVISNSINAVDDIPESEKEDFITEAQKILNSVKPFSKIENNILYVG